MVLREQFFFAWQFLWELSIATQFALFASPPVFTAWCVMAEQLSQYEQERLSNISRNKRILESMGLGTGNRSTAKHPKRKPKKSPPAVGKRRRSSRNTNVRNTNAVTDTEQSYSDEDSESQSLPVRTTKAKRKSEAKAKGAVQNKHVKADSISSTGCGAGAILIGRVPMNQGLKICMMQVAVFVAMRSVVQYKQTNQHLGTASRKVLAGSAGWSCRGTGCWYREGQGEF